MKWLLWTALVLVAIVAVITIVGWLLPVQHEASASATFDRPREDVYAVMWQQVQNEMNGGDVRMEVAEAAPPGRLVMRISPGQPFGGTWTFELLPEGASRTRLTITERGEVYNPIFRFLARFVFGYTGTMEGFLSRLREKFAQQVLR